MDPFKGIAQIIMILIYIGIGIAVIAAVFQMFHGNFVGIIIILLIFVIFIK